MIQIHKSYISTTTEIIAVINMNYIKLIDRYDNIMEYNI